MSKKINIVWIHSHFLYWMGGTKFIHLVIQQLLKNKRIKNVYVIVENSSDFSKNQFDDLGVNLISLNSLTSTNPIYWMFLPLFLFYDHHKINKIFQNHNLSSKNTVLISSMFPMNVVANLFNIKHIQNCYEPFAFFYDLSFIKQFSFFKKSFIKILSFIYAPLDKWGTQQSNTVLTLNNTTQRMIKEIYNVKTTKTQAGVNSTLFRPYVSAKIKNKYKNKKIVIHSTDYSPIKGTDLVIKAFASISPKIPNSMLLITTTIQDEQKKAKLEKLARSLKVYKRVVFLGFLPIKELPQYYSLAQVMVQGAFSEKSGTTSMSLPVKEAMCCETPAIRPDVGGEDVIDGKTGFLVDPRDTKLFAKKMSILLLNKKLSKTMGKEARKYIKNKYTWQNTAKVFLNQVIK